MIFVISKCWLLGLFPPNVPILQYVCSPSTRKDKLGFFSIFVYLLSQQGYLSCFPFGYQRKLHLCLSIISPIRIS